MKVNLKAGEVVYVNGAAIRVDRRVTLSLENDATFLLASHVVPADQALTPLRRHYTAVQALLMAPERRAELLDAYAVSYRLVAAAFADTPAAAELDRADHALRSGRSFDALKVLRRLFESEVAAPAASTSDAAGPDDAGASGTASPAGEADARATSASDQPARRPVSAPR